MRAGGGILSCASETTLSGSVGSQLIGVWVKLLVCALSSRINRVTINRGNKATRGVYRLALLFVLATGVVFFLFFVLFRGRFVVVLPLSSMVDP